jgi:hypothetical protein
MPLRRLAAAAVTVLIATSLAACGSGEPTHGETEGVYVNTGELKYQVQISRQLNASDFEDRDFLVGVPASNALARGEEWFGVFLRVFNMGKAPHTSAREFEIRDTTGKVFKPVELPSFNRTAFRSQLVGPGDQNPVPNGLARINTTQGGLILFKIPNGSFANRPLELTIKSPEGQGEATVDLDV